MQLDNLMVPRILIVEDREKILRDNENFIEEIEGERKKLAGIATFKIDLAPSVEQAINRLALRIQSPYHIVLLDLHLPEPSNRQFESRFYTTDEADNMRFRGFEILDFIRKTGSAEAVIVVSAFPENLLDAFRSGASDFVIKPHEVEELQERVLICWSRLLQKKSQQLLDVRISDLVPYAEKGLAHRLTTCFSGLVQSVAHSIEDIERYMHERYGLDRRKDSQDGFFRCLQSQEDSLSKAQREWAAVQASLLSQSESSRAESISDLVKQVHVSLRSCLIVKNVVLESHINSRTEILTFNDDVRAIVKEIMLGALNTLSDYSDTQSTIKIEAETANGQVTLAFTDRLRPISDEDAQMINRGSSIAPDRRFERAWGLSVVQHIAMRGGGRLQIEPQDKGNIVTYFIPSAN